MAIATNSPAGRTLPEHDRCDRHRFYKMTCEQFERLIAESGQLCQICRRVNGAGGHLKLAIDHCGAYWAVRGLLCNACNTRLENANAFSDAAAAYLASPWWQRECDRLGLPRDARSAEPPVGSAIRNQWGVVWIREEDGRWWAPPQPGKGSVLPFWRSMYDAYGPQNLVPVDLRAELDADTLPPSVAFALKNSDGLAFLRAALGMPEPEREMKRTEPKPPFWTSPETAVEFLHRNLSPEMCVRVGELLRDERRASIAAPGLAEAPS